MWKQKEAMTIEEQTDGHAIAKLFVDDDELIRFIESKKEEGTSQKKAWLEYETLRKNYGAKENRFKTIQSFNMWKSRFLKS